MLEALLALAFGLVTGSFLNVCIYRMPREDMSVVRPARSFCPSCKHQIAWYDNLPLLSYVMLRGRCRYCRARISLRYPVVELATGLLFFAWFRMPLPLAETVRNCLFGALLIALTFTDLEEQILPDELTLGGTAAGLFFSWFVPVDDGTARALLSLAGFDLGARVASFAEAAFGAVLPSVCLFLAGELFVRLRKKEGLGFGDVKLMAMIGAFLGLGGSLLTLILGSVLGSVIGLSYILIARKDWRTHYLPFGTFLGIGGLAVSFLGRAIAGWYLGLY